ncbi:MAG: ammonia-forming cytochrome c nitrite reductase subunit c552 [Syntrophobacteraceae bacterium]
MIGFARSAARPSKISKKRNNRELLSNRAEQVDFQTCADSHMPYTRVGVHKVSDYRVMSPFKNYLRA